MRGRDIHHPPTVRRAIGPEEPKRMIAAAKATGLDESTVASIRLRGPKAITGHESRHGYDLME
ncbi:hypothetical protein JCM24511_07336 [Saitozyma sp. JCM 24511]|nr:hypothetical protein JCM24511_07336 [Saitozyma sp. JCM 24511]